MAPSISQEHQDWLDTIVRKLRVEEYGLSKSELVQRVFHDDKETPSIVYSTYDRLVKGGDYRERGVRIGQWHIPGTLLDGVESWSIHDILSFVDSIVAGLPAKTINRTIHAEWHRTSAYTMTLRYPSHDENLLVLAFVDEVGALRAAVDTISQSDRRRFVPTLIFHRTLGRMTFAIVQRCGLLTYEFSIDEDPLLFIRILLDVFSGDCDRLGYDPTIRYCHELKASFVRVGRAEYQILERLTGIDGKFSRGTQCWKVRAPSGQIGVIKDWWHINSIGSCPKETASLWDVRKVPNVPTYIDSDIIFHSSHFINPYPHQTSAEQVRMVSSPFALSLQHFRSRKELLGIFKDIIIALKALAKKDMVHGDISDCNVLIVEETSPNDRRKGLLIDFGYSRKLDTVPTISGTPAFVASELQGAHGSSNTMSQRPIHDLESFFYLMLYTTVTYTGPMGAGKIQGLKEIFHRKVATVTDSELGNFKWKLFFFEDAFEEMLAREITPYFEPFKMPLRVLRAMLFRVDPGKERERDTGVYDQFIGVLEASELMLPADEESYQPSKDPLKGIKSPLAPLPPRELPAIEVQSRENADHFISTI